MFYLEKVGKYVIEVCRTGPCAICGGEEIMEYLEEKLEIRPGRDHTRRTFHTEDG